MTFNLLDDAELAAAIVKLEATIKNLVPSDTVVARQLAAHYATVLDEIRSEQSRRAAKARA
jgi:hypothetical protein